KADIPSCKEIFTRHDGIYIIASQSLVSKISQIFHEVIDQTLQHFVPLHIGPTAFTRDDIMQNHTPKWATLLLPQAIGMIDSTYIYVQKSWNFNNQKKSYCSHKPNNLMKMMGVMLLDGRWFDMYGPYMSDGSNNDEIIWHTLSDESEEERKSNDLCEQRKELQSTFIRTDMFVADRGFTRCKGKWALYTPDSICKGEKQLSTMKANQTRCVTRIRNGIERGFGRLKQWKFVDFVVDTYYLPTIGKIMKILCTVDNAFFTRLIEGNDEVRIEAECLLSNLELENKVKSLEAETGGWRKANID
ncbi:unnamed protein product, partial [Didymodactylos carnosus]